MRTFFTTPRVKKLAWLEHGEPSVKKSILLAVAWALIVAAASYDAYFAWRERGAFELWEMNPIVCWIAKSVGLYSVFIFKAAGLVFGVGLVIYCHLHDPRLARRFTAVVGSAYLGLSLYYLGCQIAGPEAPTPHDPLARSGSLSYQQKPPLYPVRTSPKATRIVRLSDRQA
jgi:hypothetical protein